MKKTAILPIISVLALGYAAITGHKLNDDLINQIADISAIVVTAGVSVWGIIKDHSKGVK